MSATDDPMDLSVKTLNLIAPGAGDAFRDTWNALGPTLYYQAGLALASESGAATELDYYGGGQ